MTDDALPYVVDAEVAEIRDLISQHKRFSANRANPKTLRDRLAECVASCDATPAEAAQACIDLANALQRQQNALRVQPDLLKDSHGPRTA